MNDMQTAELDMGQRARAYAAMRPADVPAGSPAALARAALDAAVTEVKQQAVKQISARLDRQEQTEQKQLAITTLVGQMPSMNQIARSINEQLKGIADQFKMPRGGDQATLDLTRSYITNAARFQTKEKTHAEGRLRSQRQAVFQLAAHLPHLFIFAQPS